MIIKGFELIDKYRYIIHYKSSIGSADVTIDFPFMLNDMEDVKALGDFALQYELGCIPDDRQFLKYEVKTI